MGRVPGKGHASGPPGCGEGAFVAFVGERGGASAVRAGGETISQFSHPHICSLYDVGREGETDYLVMELLEGESLADRLGKGALPTEQVLRYGIEIADALDKAHRQGIVHRDLKPGNIMLTKTGVKLLDFGLAQA